MSNVLRLTADGRGSSLLRLPGGTPAMPTKSRRLLRAAGCSLVAALTLLAGIGFGAPAWAQSCTSNSAPTVDMTQVSNGTWCETPSACTAQTAPAGTDAGKSFAGVFTDADGDDLTYAAGIDDDSTAKLSAFSSLGVNAAASRLSVQAKAGAHLLDVTPALPSPFGTLVHLDATDPCGDTVRVYGKFITSWTDVASVEVVSTPSGGAYDAGDRILVRVTFSGVVTVDTANGTPRLKIDLDAKANSGERWANYESGSGTRALTFGYTVAAVDASKDGIAVLKSSLERNGGTIRLGSSAAGLLHRGLAHDTSHRVGRPVIQVVEVANDPSRDSSGSGAYGAFDTYVAGDEIRIDVKFSEPVAVTGGGDVRLRLDLGTDDATPGNSRKTLTHPSMLNGGRTLRFSYAVTSSDTDPDGVWVQTDAANRVIFEPHDDQRVVSAATGVDADLTKSGLPTTGNARKKVDGSASASGPRPASATVDGTKLTVTFEAALDEAVDTGALTYFFSVQDAGGVNSGNIGAHQHPLTVSVSGSTVTLALGNGAQAGERIKLNYRYQDFKRLLRDTDGNAAPEIKDLPVTNITGGAAGPGPVRAWLEGSSLRIAFAGGLDEASQPAGSAFLVTTKDRDGSGRTIPGKGTASVTGSEVAVTLTATALRSNEEVVGASYAKPSASPLRGAGGDVRSFDNFDIAPTYVEKPRPALTASFHGMPAKHDGKRLFEFELRFSEDFEGLGLSAFEAGALQVTNGRLIDAKRTVPGENRRITARVRPDSDEAVTLTLAATDDCDAADAICAADGRKLFAPVAATVAGPAPVQGTALPTLSVAAASADEGGALSFAVALSEAAATEVTVDYATSDGSATAGTDYQAASGTLTFAAGETEKTVEVAALSDTAAEDDETFTLTLSNASGATIGTASANGTVTNANDAPLTASFHGLPAAHDGFSAFGFELNFSEEVKLSQRTLRDGSALQVANGRVTKAKRLAKGENRRWAITVQPDEPSWTGRGSSPFRAVTVMLPPTWQDCAAAGAVCTHAGKKLSAPVSATVPGPVAATPLPVLSVADASADEGGTLEFQVTLDKAATGNVTVNYATTDGSATAGADYTASSGTLTFAAGESAKTVAVAALSDTTKEDDETFTLTLSNASGATIVTAAATGTVANVLPPLTASFHGLPTEHDGSRLFAFEIRFSEEFEGLRLTAFKAGALQVTNGRIVDAKRTVQGESRRVTVRVRPSSVHNMTLTLPASTDCSAANAICVSDGRKLSGTAAATVQGPALLSVADAEVQEGAGAAVVFTVTLSRAASGEVQVDYATRDGTATAGRDYTQTRGTFTFAAGVLEKTVRVPILDDSVDEGRETFTLKLMSARGATISDGEGTGTIVNSDAVPRGWLARFGRTVAETHVDAVRDRLGANRSPGFTGRFAGQPLSGPEAQPGVPQGPGVAVTGTWNGPVSPQQGRSAPLASPAEEEALALHAPVAAGPEGGQARIPGDFADEDGILAFRSFLEGDGEDDPEARALTAEDALLGTSFIMTRDTGPGFSHGIWGRASRFGISGRDGDTDLDGEVTGAMLGTDWKRKGTIFGMVLSRSRGTGTYSGASSGEIDASLTALVPWAGLNMGDDLSVWGALGLGGGDMTVMPEGTDPIGTGIGWSMAAAGADGTLAPGGSVLGADLRWHADALGTRTSSDAATGLVATSSATTRLRLGVTADWQRTLASGATLGPRLEAGLRHDGGDAETGFGLEIGGGIGFSDPASGLSVTVDARTLALHEDGEFARWGLSLGLSWDPPPETRRGWSLAARHSLGGASSGGVDALLGPVAFPGLAGTEGEGTWLLEAAYGTSRGHGMVGSPYGQASGEGGVDNLRLGYRIEPDAAHAADASVDLWAESGTGASGRGAGAGLQWRW